jgi:hypothetical protein
MYSLISCCTGSNVKIQHILSQFEDHSPLIFRGIIYSLVIKTNEYLPRQQPKMINAFHKSSHKNDRLKMKRSDLSYPAYSGRLWYEIV